ncbi:MAG: TerC family protein, partial [Saprospiraceae bacterium]|nr:TerC family protein [Pyrinomonadaceae bacterium]
MEFLADPNVWIAFATLTLLELVLGIDNVIFISILSGKLPEEQRAKARYIGLALALVMRVILLFSLSW